MPQRRSVDNSRGQQIFVCMPWANSIYFPHILCTNCWCNVTAINRLCLFPHDGWSKQAHSAPTRHKWHGYIVGKKHSHRKSYRFSVQSKRMFSNQMRLTSFWRNSIAQMGRKCRSRRCARPLILIKSFASRWLGICTDAQLFGGSGSGAH